MNEITQLYSKTEKKFMPVHDKIVDALMNSSEELSLAEALGLLDIIKFELLLKYATEQD